MWKIKKEIGKCVSEQLKIKSYDGIGFSIAYPVYSWECKTKNNIYVWCTVLIINNQIYNLF